MNNFTTITISKEFHEELKREKENHRVRSITEVLKMWQQAYKNLITLKMQKDYNEIANIKDPNQLLQEFIKLKCDINTLVDIMELFNDKLNLISIKLGVF